MKSLSMFNLFIALLISGMLLTTGCDKKSTDPEEEDPVTAITEDENVQAGAEATATAAIYAEAMAVPTSAIVASTSGSSNSFVGKTSSTTDTIYSDCPLITVNRAAREILIDYGSGCTGVSGIAHSGSIFLKGKIESAKLYFYATFKNFTADNYQLDGTVKFRIGADSIYIDVQKGLLIRNETVNYLDGKIAIAIDLNNTLQNPFDDIYYCSMDLVNKKTIGSEEKHAFYIRTTYRGQSTPLEFRLLCEYPYRGVLSAWEIHKSKLTYFDFEPYDASCDDVVKVITDNWPDGVIISINELL